MPPKIVCRLELGFESHEQAEKVSKAVETDNEGFLTTRVEGPALVAEIRSDSLKSLLHTLDDFLACTSVAEKVVSEKISRKSP